MSLSVYVGMEGYTLPGQFIKLQPKDPVYTPDVLLNYLRSKTSLHHSDRDVKEKNNRLNCKLCHKTYKNKNSLGSHKRKYHSKQPFSCDECDYRAASKYTLKKHKLIHTKRNKTFECSECNHGYTTKDDLIQHEENIKNQ